MPELTRRTAAAVGFVHGEILARLAAEELCHCWALPERIAFRVYTGLSDGTFLELPYAECLKLQHDAEARREAIDDLFRRSRKRGSDDPQADHRTPPAR